MHAIIDVYIRILFAEFPGDGIKCIEKLQSTFFNMTVGDCGMTGRENGDIEYSNIRVCRGTYNAVKLEKGDKSRVVRNYSDVTREDVQTLLGQNRLIIP